jgi:hypothetical protein
MYLILSWSFSVSAHLLLVGVFTAWAKNIFSKWYSYPLCCFMFLFMCVFISCFIVCTTGSQDSAVGIATRYGLEGPGIGSRWGEIFRTYPDRLRGPPSLLYSGSRVFPGGKGGRGVMLTTHPLLVPRLRKSWAIPPLTLWVLLGLLWGSLYLYLYHYGLCCV